MKTKEEIEIFHKENEEKYLGKETDKGVIEKIEYLTFDGLAGGNYNSRPKIGRRGLVVGCIGNKAYPIGELKFLDNVEYLREQLKEKELEVETNLRGWTVSSEKIIELTTLIESLAGALEIMFPENLRTLADWLDKDDLEKGNPPENNEVQTDLRKWADKISEALTEYNNYKNK